MHKYVLLSFSVISLITRVNFSRVRSSCDVSIAILRSSLGAVNFSKPIAGTARFFLAKSSHLESYDYVPTNERETVRKERGGREERRWNKNSSNIKVARRHFQSLDSGETGRRKRSRERECVEIDGKKSVDQTVEPFREGLLAAIFFHRSSPELRPKSFFSRNRKSKRSHPARPAVRHCFLKK